MNSNEMLDLIKEHCPWLKFIHRRQNLPYEDTVLFESKDDGTHRSFNVGGFTNEFCGVKKDNVWDFIKEETDCHFNWIQRKNKRLEEIKNGDNDWPKLYSCAKVPVVAMRSDEAKLLSKISELQKKMSELYKQFIKKTDVPHCIRGAVDLLIENKNVKKTNDLLLNNILEQVEWMNKLLNYNESNNKTLSKIESLRRTVTQACNEMINEIKEAK